MTIADFRITHIAALVCLLLAWSDQTKANESITTQSLALSADFMFEQDSSQLTEAAKIALGEIAAQLLPNKDKLRNLLVIAHTDAIGNVAVNEKLSRGQARSIKQQFSSIGLPAELIFWLGMGETQPLTANSSTSQRAANRRIELRITGVGLSGIHVPSLLMPVEL